jgi:hypothetical protein
MVILAIALVASIVVASWMWPLGQVGKVQNGNQSNEEIGEEEEDELRDMSDDEIHSAVLAKVHGMNFSSFSLRAAKEKLQSVRAYRKKCEAMPKGRVRRSYLRWMDHFERTALKEIADYQPEARRKFYDDWAKDRSVLRKADDQATRITDP